MVHATKGILVKCDPSVMELIKMYNEKFNGIYIIQQLDEFNVFLNSEHLADLKSLIGKELDKQTYRDGIEQNTFKFNKKH